MSKPENRKNRNEIIFPRDIVRLENILSLGQAPECRSEHPTRSSLWDERLQNDYVHWHCSARQRKMKTIKQDESISRSRFLDCPVCKNHTLKLKRTVQVGRCKNCSESYKIIVLYVKTGRKTKPSAANVSQNETKPQPNLEPTLPSWQLPSDSSLFSTSTEASTGLSDTGFDYSSSEHSGEPESTSGQ